MKELTLCHFCCNNSLNLWRNLHLYLIGRVMRSLSSCFDWIHVNYHLNVQKKTVKELPLCIFWGNNSLNLWINLYLYLIGRVMHSLSSSLDMYIAKVNVWIGYEKNGNRFNYYGNNSLNLSWYTFHTTLAEVCTLWVLVLTEFM